MNSTLPIPVAVRIAEEITVRGHEWSADGPALLFLHDLGDDLDAWGSATAVVAGHGFRVISLELRGHGLSDGDASPERARSDLIAILSEVVGAFGPVGLVAYGALSEALLYLDAEHGAPVQVMISPSPLSPDGIDWTATAPAIRLVLSGTLNEGAHQYLQAIHPKMRGQNMWISGASEALGPALLLDQPQLLEHLVIFFRRYLTGYHLQWIADHADQVAAAAKRFREAPPTEGEDSNDASG